MSNNKPNFGNPFQHSLIGQPVSAPSGIMPYQHRALSDRHIALAPINSPRAYQGKGK